MECAEVKKLLSEYLDGALAAEKKALVEKHIETCHACAEELAFLKDCGEKFAALKKVKAPADFLNQVRSRLERRFSFKKMLRILFVPVHLKIPLEAAALAAAVLIIAFIFKTWQPGEEIYRGLSLPRPAAIPRRDGSEPEKMMLGKKFAGIKAEEKNLLRPEREEKPVQLALLLETESRAPARGNGAPGKGEGVVAPEQSADTKAMKIEETARARMFLAEDRVGTGDKRSVASLSVSETISRIKKLIELAEGKVIAVDHEDETDLPPSITAEIPAVNYRVFLRELARLGDPGKPLPPEVPKDEGLIRLRIELITSE